MKYCPNLGCPFFLEVGSIAEYEDEVYFCLDCETKLILGSAPIIMLPTPEKEKTQRADIKLQTVEIVESFAVARLLKEELGRVGITSTIVVSDQNHFSGNIDVKKSLFEVQVFDHHVVPALDVIQNLFEEDETEIEEAFTDRHDEEVVSSEPIETEETLDFEHTEISRGVLLLSLVGLALLLLFATLSGFSTLL